MEYLQYFVPALLLLVGLWISYRLVNYPQFADFLIAVEAEMNKVSWPSKTELIRSSLVVIFMMFFLAFILFGFDLVWRALFQALGVVK
jgi:preprotein translocase subunit SecE